MSDNTPPPRPSTRPMTRATDAVPAETHEEPPQRPSRRPQRTTTSDSDDFDFVGGSGQESLAAKLEQASKVPATAESIQEFKKVSAELDADPSGALAQSLGYPQLGPQKQVGSKTVASDSGNLHDERHQIEESGPVHEDAKDEKVTKDNGGSERASEVDSAPAIAQEAGSDLHQDATPTVPADSVQEDATSEIESKLSEKKDELAEELELENDGQKKQVDEAKDADKSQDKSEVEQNNDDTIGQAEAEPEETDKEVQEDGASGNDPQTSDKLQDSTKVHENNSKEPAPEAEIGESDNIDNEKVPGEEETQTKVANDQLTKEPVETSKPKDDEPEPSSKKEIKEVDEVEPLSRQSGAELQELQDDSKQKIKSEPEKEPEKEPEQELEQELEKEPQEERKQSVSSLRSVFEESFAKKAPPPRPLRRPASSNSDTAEPSSNDEHPVRPVGRPVRPSRPIKPLLSPEHDQEADSKTGTDTEPGAAKKRPPKPAMRPRLSSQFEDAIRSAEVQPEPKLRPKPSSGRVAGLQSALFADLSSALAKGPPGSARPIKLKPTSDTEADEEAAEVKDADESADKQISAMPTNPKSNRRRGPSRRLPDEAKIKLGVSVGEIWSVSRPVEPPSEPESIEKPTEEDQPTVTTSDTPVVETEATSSGPSDKTISEPLEPLEPPSSHIEEELPNKIPATTFPASEPYEEKSVPDVKEPEAESLSPPVRHASESIAIPTANKTLSTGDGHESHGIQLSTLSNLLDQPVGTPVSGSPQDRHTIAAKETDVGRDDLAISTSKLKHLLDHPMSPDPASKLGVVPEPGSELTLPRSEDLGHDQDQDPGYLSDTLGTVDASKRDAGEPVAADSGASCTLPAPRPPRPTNRPVKLGGDAQSRLDAVRERLREARETASSDPIEDEST